MAGDAAPALRTLPLRLMPGQDLRAALEAALAGSGCKAAFVIAGIGSLSQVRLRFAGAEDAALRVGDFEILSLSGSIATDGAHLHAALSAADGTVSGGHVAPGCTVRTTAEVLLALLPDWHFERAPDAATGFAELTIRPRQDA